MIPDPATGSKEKKTLDPGSGSATLILPHDQYGQIPVLVQHLDFLKHSNFK
jgi:hypothetical protein